MSDSRQEQVGDFLEGAGKSQFSGRPLGQSIYTCIPLPSGDGGGDRWVWLDSPGCLPREG